MKFIVLQKENRRMNYVLKKFRDMMDTVHSDYYFNIETKSSGDARLSSYMSHGNESALQTVATVLVLNSSGDVSSSVIPSFNHTATSSSGVFESKLIIPLYVIIFLLSVIGNSLVLITLAQNKRMRTVTNVYLLNLVSCNFQLLPAFIRSLVNRAKLTKSAQCFFASLEPAPKQMEFSNKKSPAYKHTE